MAIRRAEDSRVFNYFLAGPNLQLKGKGGGNLLTKFVAVLLVAGGSLFAESHFSVIIGGVPGYYVGEGVPYRYYQHQDLRGDYRDVQSDYVQLGRLRADIARDRYELQEALEDGDEWQA